MMDWGWLFEELAWVLPTLAASASLVFAGLMFMAVGGRELAKALALFGGVFAFWNLSVALKTWPKAVEAVPRLVDLFNFPLLFLPVAGLQVAFLLSGQNGSVVRASVRGAWAATGVFVVLQCFGLIFDGFSSYPGGVFAGAGPVLPAFIAFGVVTLFAGGIAAWIGLTDSEDGTVRVGSRAWLRILGCFVPFGALNFLVTYGLPVVPPASIGVLLVLACFTFDIYKSGLFGLEPETIRLAEFGLGAGLMVVSLIGGTLILLMEGPIWTAMLLLIGSVAVGGWLVRTYGQPRIVLEAWMERVFFPERSVLRRALNEFFLRAAAGCDRARIESGVAAVVAASLRVRSVALYECNDGGAAYRRTACSDGFEGPESIEGRVADEWLSIGADPAIALAVPVPGGQGSRGLLVVGPRRSGAAFSDADVTLLAMVAAQVGLALDLADARESLAEREAELADQALELASLRRRLDDEAAAIRAEVRINPKFADIIGENPRLVAALHAVEQAAAADIPVLVTGETGTGKELIANAVHALSRRSSGPLIAVNCPAIPVELAEAELFGHERGAFTGATEARPGRFENANHGTLFLDEVADLPMGVQTKLLRVLQEQESQRLGSDRVHKLDFRIVAATNRDLDAEVARGRFREDLLHRLAGVHIVVPPLRERRSDIPTLATFFLERAAHELGKEIEGLSAEALEVLVGYPWPGNIRELQNVIDRAVLLCPKSVIQPEHLGELRCDDRLADIHLGNGSLTDVLRDEKIRRVESALVRSGGNQAAAARSLGMSRSNLSRMMKRYGIKARRGAGAADTDGADAGDSAE